MSAEDLLKEGRLEEALTELQNEIRKNPADSKRRVFLFQLLAVMGQWERSLNQLNVVTEMDDAAKLLGVMYRPALQAEALRSQIFAGNRSPVIFGQPEEWMVWVVQASQLQGQGKMDEAAALREKAFEAAPTTAGTINDQAFAWIADADSRLGPMFEAVINGSPYWVPFMHVHSITVEEPTDLRDTVWASTTVQWTNGGEVFALIPVRYPGSESNEDGLIRLARKTDWTEAGEGMGQRIFATDADDYPLLEVRSIVMDNEVEGGDAPGDAHSVGLTSG